MNQAVQKRVTFNQTVASTAAASTSMTDTVTTSASLSSLPKISLSPGTQAAPPQQTVGPGGDAPLSLSANLPIGQGFAFGSVATTTAGGGGAAPVSTNTNNNGTTQGQGFSFEFPTVTTTTGGGTSTSAELAPAATTSTSPTTATSGSTALQPQVNQGLGASTNVQQQNAGQQMTFGQLQEVLNKCMADLLEEEELFQRTVNEFNAKDRALGLNGEKIASIQASVQAMKKDHVRIESALDSLQNQQLELESIVGQIEQTMPNLEPNEDPHRFRLYELMVTVDRQLLQVGKDLTTVIENINERNNLDQALPLNDPMTQITKILNQHTDALLWIENKANDLKRSVFEVQQQHIGLKMEHVANIRRTTK